MPSDKADYSVEIVTDSGQADATVVVVDGISNLSPVAGESLFFDGTNWVDRPIADGDIPAAIARDAEVAAAIAADTTHSRAASAATYFARKTIVAGPYTINGTSWANVGTGNDLVLTAATGNVIEVSLAGDWGNEGVFGALDVVSVVGGSPVNSWADNAAPDNTHFGVLSWGGNSAVYETMGGSVARALVSGDISGGQVTLRLRARTSGAFDKTLQAGATLPLIFSAKNLG